MRKLALLTFLLLSGKVYAADVANTLNNNSQIQNTTTASTKLCCAEEWGLNKEEWSRYQQLMQGPSGLWYPQLTPTEVLGINAKDTEEQQQFADVVAREEHDRLARELAFDNAVHQALLKLYGDEPIVRPFDKSAFNPIKNTSSSTTALQAGDHVVLLIDIQKGADFLVTPALVNLIKQHRSITLDIFCRGKGDDDAIRQWALLSHVPSDLVSLGRITLNHENAAILKATNNLSLPQVWLSRQGNSTLVTVGSLL